MSPDTPRSPEIDRGVTAGNPTVGSNMLVLIAEGDPGVHRLLRHTLHERGVDMVVAGSVAGALAVLERSNVDVVVVDVALPDGSGLGVLDQLRQSGSSTHSIVTSASTSGDDRAEAVGRGANEYLVKPFPIHELTTRILAVQRRDPDRDRVLRAGALTLELSAYRARIDDRLLELTAKEFDLLAYLMARPGQVFSRDQLLNEVWHSTAEWQQPATVTEHIRRLRTKIETEPRHPQILRTVRGAGYRLDIPEKPRIGTGTEIPFAPGTVIYVDGRIVRADEAAVAMFDGDASTALVGRRIPELISPASRAATFERTSSDRPGPECRTQLIDLERVDGPDLTVEVTSKEFHWNGGRAQHLTLTPVRDLSARLLRLVTAVLSEVTDAVIITDLHFHVRSWNEAAERLYGWRQHDVLGRHVLDIIQWISDDTDPLDIWDTLVRTSRWKGNGQQVTRGGAVIDVLACTTLIRNDAGAPVAIVSVNRACPSPSAELARVQNV